MHCLDSLTHRITVYSDISQCTAQQDATVCLCTKALHKTTQCAVEIPVCTTECAVKVQGYVGGWEDGWQPQCPLKSPGAGRS